MNFELVIELLRDGIQIFLLTWFFYYVYTGLYRNMATRAIRTVMCYICGYILSNALRLTVLYKLFESMLVPFFVFVFILYQPELRRTFTPGPTNRVKFLRVGTQTSVQSIDMIITACKNLMAAGRGALIIFPRTVELKFVESGVKIDAEISTELIETIFMQDTDLHDGAIIVRGDRIDSARCFFNLSEQSPTDPDFNQSFGTRHRAALSVAEYSDAIVIVVSEEKGCISLAYGGKIQYAMNIDKVKGTLLSLFNNADRYDRPLQEDANEER